MTPALHSKGFSIPTAENGGLDYTMTLPSLIAHYYPTGILGVGITALIASFMSGMAGNVTAFNTVFTFDIYQSRSAERRVGSECRDKCASEGHAQGALSRSIQR